MGDTADMAPARQVNPLRQPLLEQALALGGDESVAVAFILSCSVAEARFAAAQKIHGRTALLQLRNAMRETDRRVAKLVQQRLDALVLRERSDRQVKTVLDRAQQLCDSVALLPNQVIDLERAWRSIDAALPPAQQAFEALHNQLLARLQAQLALQRQVLDAIKVSRDALAAPLPGRHMVDAAASASSAALQKAQDDVEKSGLPKHLLPELSLLHSRLQRLKDDALADLAAVTAREAALLIWEKDMLPAVPLPATDAAHGVLQAVTPTAPILALARMKDSETPVLAATSAPVSESPESMLLTWQSLPAVSDVDEMQRLQARFDALRELPALATPPLQQELSPSTPLPAQSVPPDVPMARKRTDDAQQRLQFGAVLDALRAALDEGALQKAVEHDRFLRLIDTDEAQLAPAQRSALGAARAELGRLQAWAKWGGTVSREELLSAVETLSHQTMPVEELAEKIGSMRERWRALDTSAGPAPRALWTRFDAACTDAYAPAAAHFAALAQARAANAQKARVLLDEVTAFVDTFGLLPPAITAVDRSSSPPFSSPDWRAIAAFRVQTRQAWRRVGPLERREQKRLDAAFAKVMQPLDAAVVAHQHFEVCQRERLIEEATHLPGPAQDTPERLQALQTLWQSYAKSFPLPRRIEQELWQRFRGACDAVFTERKLVNAAADTERKDNLRRKAALCELLEKAAADTELCDREGARVAREARADWDAVGQVPRAVMTALQARFNAAVRAVEARPAMLRQAALRRDCVVARQKLALCQQCENMLLARDPIRSAMLGVTNATATVDALQTQWSAMPSLAGEAGTALTIRFETAMTALACDDSTHARVLEERQPERDAILLRLEVAAGIDTPAAFVRERLAMQVANLRSTFKDGIPVAPETGLAELAKLLAIPAFADPAAQLRMDRVFEALARPSPA